MVVPVDGGPAPGRGREVVVAEAELDGGGQGGVVHVLRVTLTVRVAVDPGGDPGRGQDLHRADGVVEEPVAVEEPGIGVADQCGAVAPVQRDAEDPGAGDAVGAEPAAVRAAVVALDPPDGGEQLPVEVAAGVGLVDHDGRPLVRREGDGRDVGHGGRGDRPVGQGRPLGEAHDGTQPEADRGVGPELPVGDVGVGQVHRHLGDPGPGRGAVAASRLDGPGCRQQQEGHDGRRRPSCPAHLELHRVVSPVAAV